MKNILSILMTLLFVSSYSQNIYDLSHSTIYVVKDSSVYTNKGVKKFTLSKKNHVDVCCTKSIAEVQGDGGVLDYEEKQFIGYIGENKITDGEKKVLAYIYPDFGYMVDDKKKKICYFDSNVNYKIVALIMLFYKDLD